VSLVGIDLGGTNIRAARATPDGHGPRVERRTPQDDGPDGVLRACADAAREAAGDEALEGIAIGVPGLLDPHAGIVHNAPHLPGFNGLDAGPRLERLAGCPVAMNNDASLAGFAEWDRGAGARAERFVFITVSTGIGGAIILDGSLATGGRETSGEIGHMPALLDGPACGAGHNGCLEGFASGTAIAARFRSAVAAGEPSTLAVTPGLDAAAIAAAARGGDALAHRIYTEAGRAVGRALGGVINLLAPEIVVIGGGLINNADLLMENVHSGVGEIAFDAAREGCRIELAALGTDAGLVGAVAWAVRSFAPAAA
jgi:glucokinase